MHLRVDYDKGFWCRYRTKVNLCVFIGDSRAELKFTFQSAGSRTSTGILCDGLSIRNKLQLVPLAHLEYRDTNGSDVLKFAPRRVIVPRGRGKLRNEWLGPRRRAAGMRSLDGYLFEVA